MSKQKKTINRRDFLKIVGLAGAGLGAAAVGTPLMSACRGTNEADSLKRTTPQQIPLPGGAIPKFIDALPKLEAAGGTIQTIVADTNQIQIEMQEFRSNMLPSTFNGGNYAGTWVWGYVKSGTDITKTRDTYTGPVVVASRGTPSEFKFINNLGTTKSTKVIAYVNSTDQSLHWANPNMVDRYSSNSAASTGWVGNPEHYSGAIPAAVHLHGGEVPAAIDGGPDSWFTSSGQHGRGFYSKDQNTKGNYCIYRYPNAQEAAPIWFHDHTLGATRLNVYCGLAGGYLLVDPNLDLPSGLSATGLRDGALGPNAVDDAVIPLVIQDRTFDTNGQLYFPSGPLDSMSPALNPEHKWWVPEFFGNTACVNGKVWPYLEVKAQRYRFLIINGSNARTWALTFQGNELAPSIWQIATDQGYLDKAVIADPLVLMPGERAEVVVDFGALPSGSTLVLNNVGPDSPFSGILSDQEFSDPDTTGQVMQVRVVPGGSTNDAAFDPNSNVAIRKDDSAIVRLADPSTGTLAPGVLPSITRLLTLNEIVREESITLDGIRWSGGPLEVLLNNTRLTGRQPNEIDPNDMVTPPAQPDWKKDGLGNYLSELPVEGTTEIWEIANLTMDAHPIHTHLAQFQLINRQALNTEKYLELYGAAFTDGEFKPGAGPPMNYTKGFNKYGGNPDITSSLQGQPIPPKPNEAGWKDTVMAPTQMVTRFVVRWAPADIPATTPPGSTKLRYPFLPNDAVPGNPGASYSYVWHCHIVDHEDNEMMRPNQVVPDAGAVRTLSIAKDY
jgi:spore coat protein A, manganese oxidase